MSKIDRTCQAAGVRIVPSRQRRRGRETHARRVLTKLACQYGEGHVIFVLRTITESRDNGHELWSETILAVSDVVRLHPYLAERGLAFIEAFDSIRLRDLRLQAKTMGMATSRQALGVLLMVRLRLLMAEAPDVSIIARTSAPQPEADRGQSSRAA